MEHDRDCFCCICERGNDEDDDDLVVRVKARSSERSWGEIMKSVNMGELSLEIQWKVGEMRNSG